MHVRHGQGRRAHLELHALPDGLATAARLELDPADSGALPRRHAKADQPVAGAVEGQAPFTRPHQTQGAGDPGPHPDLPDGILHDEDGDR